MNFCIVNNIYLPEEECMSKECYELGQEYISERIQPRLTCITARRKNYSNKGHNFKCPLNFEKVRI